MQKRSVIVLRAAEVQQNAKHACLRSVRVEWKYLKTLKQESKHCETTVPEQFFGACKKCRNCVEQVPKKCPGTAFNPKNEEGIEQCAKQVPRSIRNAKTNVPITT